MSRDKIERARDYFDDDDDEKEYEETERRSVVRMRDELNNVRGLLLGVSLLIKDDEYKLYVHNPVEHAMIIVDQKLHLIEEGLSKLEI